MATRLTLEEKKERLLGALRYDNWQKRQDIARGIKLKTLGHADRMLLDILVDEGRAERRELSCNAPSGVRLEYRIAN